MNHASLGHTHPVPTESRVLHIDEGFCPRLDALRTAISRPRGAQMVEICLLVVGLVLVALALYGVIKKRIKAKRATEEHLHAHLLPICRTSKIVDPTDRLVSIAELYQRNLESWREVGRFDAHGLSLQNACSSSYALAADNLITARSHGQNINKSRVRHALRHLKEELEQFRDALRHHKIACSFRDSPSYTLLLQTLKVERSCVETTILTIEVPSIPPAPIPTSNPHPTAYPKR